MTSSKVYPVIVTCVALYMASFMPHAFGFHCGLLSRHLDNILTITFMTVAQFMAHIVASFMVKAKGPSMTQFIIKAEG